MAGFEEEVEETPTQEEIPTAEPSMETDNATEETTTEVPPIAEAEPASENNDEPIVKELAAVDSIAEIPTGYDAAENAPISKSQEDKTFDFSIPELTPSEEEPEQQEMSIPIEIKEEIPTIEENTNEVEEVTIPDMPPLPEISDDDTTSIPVIPIAEPSIDDNFGIDNNDSEDNNETSTPEENDITSDSKPESDVN